MANGPGLPGITLAADMATQPDGIDMNQTTMEIMEGARRPEGAPAEHAPRVMLVEDSPTERMRLGMVLTQFGYEVVLAGNGEEALRLHADMPVDMVISDWQMPVMNGLALCRHLHRPNATNPPYFILITASEDRSAMIEGMDAGADDFLHKPFNKEAFRVRVQAGSRILRLRRELEQRNRSMLQALQRETAAAERLQSDLRAAATMQRDLLPPGGNPEPGWSVATLFQPAAVVAGDWYNYFPVGEHHLGFYHLDVAGHGVPAAMLSFTLARFLTPTPDGTSLLLSRQGTAAADPVDPGAVVAELNRRFQHMDENAQYFTMVYGIVDLRDGRGQLCQAGHPHPLLVRTDGRVAPLGNGGFPVGVFANAEYESTPFQLRPGERLLVYSDGITDCAGPDGQRLGYDPLVSFLQQEQATPPEALLPALERRLSRWRGEGETEDDISALCLGHDGLRTRVAA